MDPSFWQERWEAGQIGFHQPEGHPALRRFWTRIDQGSRARVLVPLCGKSPDLHWLAGQGHPVTGCELSPLAVDAFFQEWGHEPVRQGRKWHYDGIEIVVGDFFDYQPSHCFQRFYDRAALIALPASMRSDYLEHLARLTCPGAEGLLITLQYPQERREGPPFSVAEDELMACPYFEFEHLAAQDIDSTFPGLIESGRSLLSEHVYRARRRDRD
ncbi:thiopurine S-methyltransferase [Wenzhouxiangella marina]|uniref:Thiopurine S-methyltransferase n=1 Tax=Wenzhouxiangella marina TaxID=1579979 RepID=A0A0K0XWJ6_9GAMM|nr:thiopurine S-methyltransferase [Wenzhouxiangella marina]AKS42053.1 Thiopurine S-methyltransferase [Wenzhouxiangella marina]MBB6086178.1 thiopurine S-methyltransferase [Wenzhouxiangella marina]